MRTPWYVPAVLCILAAASCGGGESAGDTPGVDLENKVLRVGLLNDLSGPASAIGRQVQTGYEILYRRVNAGGSGLLPDGWTVDWVTRDHGYNPQQAVQAYNEISDDVLFLGMSFGTPTTLPLHPMMSRDHMFAIPASLSSRTGQNEFTPVTTPTYRTEAMRAVDWAVGREGTDVRIGIVYQQDEYGLDAVEGLQVEAAFHGVEIVAEQPITPGQADFTAVVSALRSAGAQYVMLGILPSATGPLLGTAAQLGYAPVWMGNSPAWLDAFFDPNVVPPAIFANYHTFGALRYWGEDVPGMPDFLQAFQAFGEGAAPDSYIITGYVWASVGIEAARRAIEAGNVTREGLMDALHTIQGWDVNGMYIPIDLSTVPYDASRMIRITTPNMAERTWTVVEDYAPPLSDGTAN